MQLLLIVVEQCSASLLNNGFTICYEFLINSLFVTTNLNIFTDFTGQKE